jgi:hypothetical protein
MMSPTQTRILELKEQIVALRLKQIKESEDYNKSDPLMKLIGVTDEDLKKHIESDPTVLSCAIVLYLEEKGL